MWIGWQGAPERNWEENMKNRISLSGMTNDVRHLGPVHQLVLEHPELAGFNGFFWSGVFRPERK